MLGIGSRNWRLAIWQAMMEWNSMRACNICATQFLNYGPPAEELMQL